MSDTKVKAITVDGRTVDIFVTSTGQFWASLNDREDEPKAPTLKQLEDKIKTIVRRKRASIPATLITGSDNWRDGHDVEELTVEHITLTGIHQSHNKVLYRDSKGDADSLSGWHDDARLCRRLTEEEVTTLQGYWQAKEAAKKQYEEYQTTLKLDGHKAIRQAMGVPEEED
jgi:hypothetical protein